MATKLGLYNSALQKIKQRRLVALTDNVPSRLECDAVYNDVLAYMLEQGNWNFAKRSIELQPSSTYEPVFGFANAFDRPNDFVRLVSISSNPSFWPPMVANQYSYDGATGAWEADCNPLYVAYVSNDASYGGNLGNWTQTFSDAVAYEIAVRIAPNLTNIADADFKALVQLGTRALRNAKTKDALNDANQKPPPGELIMSRRNYRNRTLWER